VSLHVDAILHRLPSLVEDAASGQAAHEEPRHCMTAGAPVMSEPWHGALREEPSEPACVRSLRRRPCVGRTRRLLTIPAGRARKARPGAAASANPFARGGARAPAPRRPLHQLADAELCEDGPSGAHKACFSLHGCVPGQAREATNDALT